MYKPICLGASILDISKILMYDLHYNYIKSKYGDKASLLFTDTDSLCYEVKTGDGYKDISPDVSKWFDTSKYDKDHPSGIPTGKNEKVIGMMKDKCKRRQIKKFIGLRSKMYSYVMEDGGEEKKCKGIKKNVVKNEITYQDYKDSLFGGGIQLRMMNTFRSRQHTIYTECVNKIALSANDDKHIICKDGINTYAYGHYKTK